MSRVVLFLGLFACLLASGCQLRSQGRVSAPTAAPLEHVVVAGDTLSSVAELYGVSVNAIVDANDLRERTLRPGRRLTIPGGHRPEPVVAQPELAPEPVKPVGPATNWFQPRSSWAREPIVLSRTTPMGGTPMRITVHHSGDGKDAQMNSVEWLRLVDHQHMLGQGKAIPWACIGYHFIIAPDGKVYEGRPLKYQGAHAGWDEVNRLNIGVCLIGEFDNRKVPQAQRESLLHTLDQLCLDYGINRTQVFGHKHFKVTECPGRYVSAIIDAYAQREPGPVAPRAEPLPAGATKLSVILPPGR